MNVKIIAIVLILMLSKYSFSQNQGFFDVRGKDIIGPDGKNILIRGVNLGNWLVPEGYMFKLKSASSPRLINEAIAQLIGPDEAKSFWDKYLDTYITKADIQFLKEKGSNSIRIPFHYKMFTNEEYLGSTDAERGFKLIDRVLKWCKEENLYVILDMHCAPGGQTGDNIDDSYGYPFLFESAESQQLTIDIWRRIAKRYKDEKIIIGYDLLNEPIAHYFDIEKLNPHLEPLYKRIVAAVREEDKQHLVFLGGAQWNSNFKVFGAPFDSKSVYTFHKYWTKTGKEVIQDYLDFRDKYNVPLYMGESGENNDEWIAQFRTTLEQNNVGWHFWPYKKMDSESCMLNFKKPAHYDRFIQFAETSRASFEDLRKAVPQDRTLIKQALDVLLDNCTFQNCKANTSYIEALGFK